MIPREGILDSVDDTTNDGDMLATKDTFSDKATGYKYHTTPQIRVQMFGHENLKQQGQKLKIPPSLCLQTDRLRRVLPYTLEFSQ